MKCLSLYFRHFGVFYLCFQLVLSNILPDISRDEIDIETTTTFSRDDDRSHVSLRTNQSSQRGLESYRENSSSEIADELVFLRGKDIIDNGTDTEYDTSEDNNEHSTNDTISPVKLTIRKCCQENEYFNSNTNECFLTSDLLKFIDEVKVMSNVSRPLIDVFSKKIEDCLDVGTAETTESYQYQIVEDGKILDQNLNIVYSHNEYCLEMVGIDMNNSSLVLVYCSANKNIIPKCCPPGYFENSLEKDCTPYVESDDQAGDSSLNLYFDENSELGISNLVCLEPTVTFNLNETYFHGNFLCLNSNGHCLHSEHYCIENVLRNGSTELTPVSYICPETFIKKCCPEGEGVHDFGCDKLDTHSPYITETFNSFTYRISGVINFDSSYECNPLLIDKYHNSNMSWELDTEGNAVVDNRDGSIMTRKFCVDDYVKDNESTPVIKICSEEVNEYAPVFSFENYPENVLGKCCPPSQHYHAGKCVDSFNDTTVFLDDSELIRFNISELLFKDFPSCRSVDKYHSYIVGEDLINDYVMIAEQRKLKVINVMNHCKIKETEVTESKYCLEHADNSGNEFKLHAFVCIAEQKNIHSEKSAIVVVLVGFSCVALIASFFILLCMRVRRGMFTVRKVNTLAGKILMSYVISLLIGYVTLGVSYLADFGEKSGKCFALTGVLQFSMIAAFCWNTSICLEGFLLTMDIKMSEHRRYVFHSLSAWGIAGSITSLTLILDHYSEHLSCGVITPRIGLERCFFSNNTALLLYFYLPITITVILNGFLLVASKILRIAQLRKLENNIGAKKEKSIEKPKSERKQATATSSGLRTHQSGKNMLMEYFRLVVWSGGTWLMEIIGTLVTMFGGISEGRWYTYLWYLPVSFNCLRGLGIFFLILSTSEYFSKFDRLFKILNCRKEKSTNEQELSSHQYKKSIASEGLNTLERSYSANDERKQSTATNVTDITLASSVHQESPNSHKFYRSVSQAVPNSSSADNLKNINESLDSECVTKEIT